MLDVLEMHLRQQGFTYNVYWPLTKRYRRFKIYLSKWTRINQNFPRRTITDKIPHDKVSDNAKKVKNMMDINVDLLQSLINKLQVQTKEHELILI